MSTIAGTWLLRMKTPIGTIEAESSEQLERPTGDDGP
jgi:hypothetical protein